MGYVEKTIALFARKRIKAKISLITRLFNLLKYYWKRNRLIGK